MASKFKLNCTGRSTTILKRKNFFILNTFYVSFKFSEDKYISVSDKDKDSLLIVKTVENNVSANERFY
jgi:hypothetical protein